MSVNYKLIENMALKETLYHYRVDPGLDLFVLPRPGYQKKYAIFSTRFGSVDNRFRVEPDPQETTLPDGVAHFLEHKLFESEAGNVFERFAALGASANAYTSFTQTTYLFSCTDLFEESFDQLLDFVQDPYFTEKTVAKEQGIIGQEIKMYEDHPHWRVFFNLLESLYQIHPVRNDIAGTVDSIAQITPDLLYRCYNTFYHPANMAIFVVGDLEPARIYDLVSADLAARGYKPQGQIIRLFPDEPEGITRPKAEQELVVSEPVLFVGFKDINCSRLTGRELMRREILMEILLQVLFGTSERLYNDLYKADLIDEGFGAEYTAETGYAYAMVGGETKDPDQTYEKIMNRIARMDREGISEEQFERHRRKMLGSYIRRFNSLEFIANNFLAYRFRGSDLFDLPALLHEVSREEVLALAEENLNPGRHAVSLINPAEG